MIFKLHLTREELNYLSFAAEAAQRIHEYFVSMYLEGKAFPFPDNPFPFSDKEIERISGDLERAPVIIEKIRLLTEYADRTQDVINAYKNRSEEISKARFNAMNQRRIYLKYALNGLSNIPDPEPDQNCQLDQDLDLEIPEI